MGDWWLWGVFAISPFGFLIGLIALKVFARWRYGVDGAHFLTHIRVPEVCRSGPSSGFVRVVVPSGRRDSGFNWVGLDWQPESGRISGLYGRMLRQAGLHTQRVPDQTALALAKAIEEAVGL